MTRKVNLYVCVVEVCVMFERETQDERVTESKFEVCMLKTKSNTMFDCYSCCLGGSLSLRLPSSTCDDEVLPLCRTR